MEMMRRNSKAPTQIIINKELLPGEKVLWSGRPQQGIVFRKMDALLIPFSLFWGGFAIFWEVNALLILTETTDPIALVFPLFGIPFVLIGLYIIFGRFMVDAKARSKTIYGLTNKRAIVVSGLFSKKVKSVDLNRLSDVSLNEKSDGLGTVLLGPESPFSNLMYFPFITTNQTPQFELIENPRSVYSLIIDNKPH